MIRLKRLLVRLLLVLLALLLIAGVAFWRGATPDLPVEELAARYAPPPSRFVPLAGMQVHIREEGSGPPLLLLHGTGASLHTWDGWVQELKEDFRIIRIDLPGYGLTGPHPTHDYSAQAYTRLLTDLLDWLGIEKVHIAGNSLGGRIAWEFAATAPERVDRLILIDPSGYPTGKAPTLAFRLGAMPVANLLLRHITPRQLFENSLKEVYADDSKVTEELVTRYYELFMRQGNREAFIARMRTGFAADTARIALVQAPTLVMWGEKDAWIPAEHASRFARDLPNATLQLYPDAGHVPMEEEPAATAADAWRFLTANLSPPDQNP